METNPSNEIKYNTHHFPVGTLVTFYVPGVSSPTTTARVKELIKNGADSYVAVLDETYWELSKTEKAINITHCIKILERGSGEVVIRKDPPLDISPFRCKKHHTQYGTYNFRELIYNLTLDYSSPTAILDFDKLLAAVYKRIPEATQCWANPITINKKKLRRIIKDNFNKCLTTKKKALRAEEEQKAAMYEEYFDNEY